MLTRRGLPHDRATTRVLAPVAAVCFALTMTPVSAFAAAKHFFRVIEVLGAVDEGTREKGRALLERELEARELFTSDAGVPEVTAAALQAQGRRGFDVSLRFEGLSKEVKPPAEGRKLKQLVVGVKISLVGTDIVGSKLAFSGDGESMQISEVDERHLDKESASLVADVMADAIKQAVNQAVLKLSGPKFTAPKKGKPQKRKANTRGAGRAR